MLNEQNLLFQSVEQEKGILIGFVSIFQMGMTKSHFGILLPVDMSQIGSTEQRSIHIDLMSPKTQRGSKETSGEPISVPTNRSRLKELIPRIRVGGRSRRHHILHFGRLSRRNVPIVRLRLLSYVGNGSSTGPISRPSVIFTYSPSFPGTHPFT